MMGDRITDSEKHYLKRLSRTLGRYVNHENVYVRAVSFWGFCAVVFSLVWVGSYHILPEGLLRGTSLAYVAPVETDEIETTFLRIFGWNLLVSGGIIVVANTLRSVNTPMGYLVVLVSVVNGALVWGTGSLALEVGRIEPSLATIVGRSGGFELSAFVLIAVATREVMLWHQESPPRWREDFERVRSPRDWEFSRSELLVLVTGIALLAAANYREAAQIIELTP
ncbi:hypothetical protein ACLI4Y_12550 [Natrialbaceae archaeon A-CW3]